MEICDFGTVLYPFTTINKVLYSVFFFILSNGYRDFDLKFDIEIYRGRPKSMRFMHQASYYVVKIVDNIFGILPHKNICICLLLILDKLAAGAVLLAPLLLRETQ